MDDSIDDPIDVDPVQEPEFSEQQLRITGISRVNEAYISLNLGPSVHREASDYPANEYYISANGFVTTLVWRPKFEEPPIQVWFPYASLQNVLGWIRDQYNHRLCWDYVATDLVSSECVLRGWESKYHPRCAWNLYATCRPDLIGKDLESAEGHVCYAYDVHCALEHIHQFGVPLEVHKNFSCHAKPEPASFEFPGIPERIRSVKAIESLREALYHLQYRPIAADVIVFPELFSPGDHVYYGPLAPNTSFWGYHAVIIESVMFYRGDFVARCKMSNGPRVANFGYAFISLTTMFMVVGIEKGKEAFVRQTPRAVHLLTNFVALEMYTREEQNIERQRREAQENLQQLELREKPEKNVGAHDQLNLKEQIQPDTDQAQENLQQLELREKPENQNVDAHDQLNLKEQIQPDTDQAQENLQQLELREKPENENVDAHDQLNLKE